MRRGLPALAAGAALVVAGCTGGDDAEAPRPTESASTATDEPSAAPTPDDDARAALLTSARIGAERILSYDYRTLDLDAELAGPLMTEEFKQQYDALIAGLRDRAVATEASTRAASRGEGLIGVTVSTAAVLVLFDQTTRRGTQPKSVTPQAAVVSLVLEEGRWLVSNLELGEPASLPAEPDPERQAALAAASAVTDALLNVSWRTIDADIAATVALATGAFRTEFKASTATLRDAISSNHTVQTGRVVAAGLSSWTGTAATVLVTTDGSSKVGKAAPVARSLRLELHLVLEHGRWLASEITFVERPT
jgi:Mce-associated membrane protein